MPLEQSIHWKPLRDPHYVVASLQPADGGRRKIFVRQQVVARVESLVHVHGRRTVGLLLGQLYQCSVTGVDYLVVESISDHDVVRDESELAAKVAEALSNRESERHGHFLGSADDRMLVLGWYRGVHTVEARPSLTTAGVHVSLFSEPWQTTLVVSEGGSPDGAFFLRDSVNSSWFFAPFYELLSHAPEPNQPKTALVNWPQYMTAEPVVPAVRDADPQGEKAAPAVVQPPKRNEQSWLRRSPATQNVVQRADLQDPDVELPDGPPSPASPLSATPTETRDEQRQRDDAPMPAPQPAADRPLTDRPAPRPIEPGLADAGRGSRERAGWRRTGKSSEKLSIVDDRDQRTSAPSSTRRISDDDDTAMGDDATRYIEIARAEGFFVAAKFDAAGGPTGTETLWVLNEPYSGLLLAVVSTNSQVVDATLHYNLQTDAEGLKKAPFPEHRDPESNTIYVRETCVDALRARCRRLRATNALLREWKVTPAISFLTPGEWESIPVAGTLADRASHVLSDLNKSRIAELPEGVRSQFHLSVGGATA
jgi:hypothetical protein